MFGDKERTFGARRLHTMLLDEPRLSQAYYIPVAEYKMQGAGEGYQALLIRRVKYFIYGR